MKRWIFVVLVACACPSKPTSAPPVVANSGSAAVEVSPQVTCDSVKAKVEALYRTEAQTKEPKRVEDAARDNTRMVMNDCAKNPAKFAPCLAKAQTIAEIEAQCIVPLDDEGTEGVPK